MHEPNSSAVHLRMLSLMSSFFTAGGSCKPAGKGPSSLFLERSRVSSACGSFQSALMLPVSELLACCACTMTGMLQDACSKFCHPVGVRMTLTFQDWP